MQTQPHPSSPSGPLPLAPSSVRFGTLPSGRATATVPTSPAPAAQAFRRIAGAFLAFFAGALLLGEPIQGWLAAVGATGHGAVYAHGHSFVDARVLGGIPNAVDVLSNAVFLVFGVAGLLRLRRMQATGVGGAISIPGLRTTQPTALRTPKLAQPVALAAAVFFAGLVLTAAVSACYHWAPSHLRLMGDRLGMALAFTGVVGLVVADKIGVASVRWCLGGLGVASTLAAAIAYQPGWVAPWAVVQFGGMALVAWAAWQPSVHTRPAGSGAGLQINFGWLIAAYVVAKAAEMGDAAVFAATHELISGHSLKHVLAGLAAWPVLAALGRTK